jgi:POT family proton-dependent oligopeptide transporter
VKMVAAMVLIAASFGAMVAAAQAENHTVTTIALEALPEGASLETLDGGRLHFDAARRELTVRGVLPPFVVTSALEAVASPSYREQLARMPDADAQTKGRLLRQTTPPVYAQALDALSTKSDQARVGGTWLLISYFFATLGELCLSPVGLSMVTKLAPTRFASLLMGVWMLGSSVAQYVGGSLGESWGKIAPTSYFTTFVWTSCAGALVLAVLVAPLKRLMHDAVR